jgi:hypothetical protein
LGAVVDFDDLAGDLLHEVDADDLATQVNTLIRQILGWPKHRRKADARAVTTS